MVQGEHLQRMHRVQSRVTDPIDLRGRPLSKSGLDAVALYLITGL